MKIGLQQPLSIIYLHNQRLMGGKAHDIVIMRTCYALARAGHRVKIITGRPAGHDDIFSYYGIAPVPEMEIVQVPMLRGKPFSWHAIFNYFSLLKILSLKKGSQAPDIIYLREIKLARFLLRFRKLLKLPLVIEVHDMKIKKFYDTCPEKDPCEHYVFHRADGIVVLLNTFADILRETYGIKGIPVAKVPLAAEKIPFRHAKSDQRIIGYIGQLYPMQGVDILIEAMKYIPGARLSIIGGGEKDLRRLRTLAAEIHVAERVDFHGFVSPRMAMEKAMKSDVMVICALDRGKRRYAAHTKLYEYMAMGKPIVAVDLPSVREEVTEGRDAILARPEDPKDLAEKISLVLDNRALAESLAIGAYTSADEFSWEKRAEKLSAFFLSVHADYRNK